MNEEEIIQGICATGSKQSEALTHLYRYKGSEFKRYFKFKGVSESQCDDLLQQVILKIFTAASGFKGGIGFSENSANAWMWAIARNCLNDFFSEKKRESEIYAGSINDQEWTVSNTKEITKSELASNLSLSNRKQELEIDLCVTNGIEEFCAQEPDRATVLMMQMDGESIESIARRIGRTSDAAKQYISQCKKKLQPFIQHCLTYTNEHKAYT
jgi:RNA polymerase sigma factor (sigma-70 family)